MRAAEAARRAHPHRQGRRGRTRGGHAGRRAGDRAHLPRPRPARLSRRPKTAVYRAIERGLARRTDRLLAVTPRVRDELLALGVGTAAQYRAVPLGFDLAPLLVAERRQGELRAELGLARRRWSASWRGWCRSRRTRCSLAPRARIRRRPRRAVPRRWRWRMPAGARGPRRRARAARRGAVPRLARRPRPALRRPRRRRALTSRNEGSPVALIEAMAAGRAGGVDRGRRRPRRGGPTA